MRTKCKLYTAQVRIIPTNIATCSKSGEAHIAVTNASVEELTITKFHAFCAHKKAL